jgi:archaellum component FlaF (FlaF/FlaG flagellin family)
MPHDKHKGDLTHIRQYAQCIKIAKENQNMIAEEMDDLEFKECSLKNVSYVPELSRNLLSVNCITENGGEVLFTKEKVQILKNKIVVMEGKKAEMNCLWSILINKK